MNHDEFPDKQVLGVLVNRFEDAHADHERFNKLPADEKMVSFMQDVRDFAAGVHDMMRYTVSAYSSCPHMSADGMSAAAWSRALPDPSPAGDGEEACHLASDDALQVDCRSPIYRLSGGDPYW